MSEKQLSINEAMKLAVELHRAGQLEQAAGLYARIRAAAPGFADVFRLSGQLEQKRGNHLLAVEFLRQALALAPSVQAGINLGFLLLEMNHNQEAVDVLQAARAEAPENVRALLLLGMALKNLGRHAEAITFFEQLLSHAPDAVDSHAPYAQSLQATGRLDEAVQHYRRALEIDPVQLNTWNNLGMALLAQGKPDEAAAALKRALQLDPRASHIHSNLIFALMFNERISAEDYLHEARRYGAAVSEGVVPFNDWLVGNPGSDTATLRVGFLSGDFREHAVGYFLENFMARMDRHRVQQVAYSTLTHEDQITRRLKPGFVEWHDISKLSDAAAAQKIRADRIHVLVDLAGHTAHNRLPVMAWKPAPVQVSWLGFSASTGMKEVDWLPVDEISVPVSARGLYAERLWYLPDTRVCFTPPADVPATSVLPALANGYITFGCFQSMKKLSDNVLTTWARILAATGNSRLRVQNGELDSPAARENFLVRMAALAIPAERIVMAGAMPRAAYLAAHAEVDIILDTFPYPGGTTTCEALWMGVPTLTCAGRTLLSRYGASVLNAVGLRNWIANNTDEYVSMAVAQAADISTLAEVRSNLRVQMQHSPLCNGELFAQRFADALHGMWRETHKPVAFPDSRGPT